MADPTQTRPAVTTPRRYHLLKSRTLDEQEEQGLAAAFRSRQYRGCGVRLPDNFPELSKLASARYVTVEDLDGATAEEIAAATGLNLKTAERVLHALDQLLTDRETMGYTRSTGTYAGRYADTLEVNLMDQSSTGTSGNSDGFELGDRGVACLTLDVTTATAGTLDVAIKTSKDNGVSDPWRAVNGSPFTQVTTPGSERKSFSGCDRFIRAEATIVTGPFAFTISGEAK